MYAPATSFSMPLDNTSQLQCFMLYLYGIKDPAERVSSSPIHVQNTAVLYKEVKEGRFSRSQAIAASFPSLFS